MLFAYTKFVMKAVWPHRSNMHCHTATHMHRFNSASHCHRFKQDTEINTIYLPTFLPQTIYNQRGLFTTKEDYLQLNTYKRTICNQPILYQNLRKHTKTPYCLPNSGMCAFIVPKDLARLMVVNCPPSGSRTVKINTRIYEHQYGYI